MPPPLFGLNVSTSAAAGADPVAEAVRAEELRFDFVSANDHPSGSSPSFETWTMLSWIAARTTEIKVATRVLGVPYRSPAMVAKMAETLNRLSGGRLILGLGGGYSDHEFRAFGLPVPSPREKVDGLEEAVNIMRGLWSREKFTYSGKHHTTEAAELEPKPDTNIPIWLGTFGPRALAVTGRVADGWIPSLDMAPPSDIPALRAIISTAARESGRDPDEVSFVYNMEIGIADQPNPNPEVVVGPVDHVIDRLIGFVQLGAAAMNFNPIGPDREAQVALLAQEVIPEVKAAGRNEGSI
ncbi:MAG: hypothetical protein QOG54_1609 [Actinomycetota bacterium]|nr:hypothetical protein [Actinomycetota bacterium]